MRRPGLARIADRIIGRLEKAAVLDGPSYAAETVLSRPAQLAGSPAEGVSNALHGTRWGHPVHPMLVALPIGTWTFAVGLDLLAVLGLLRSRSAEQAAAAAVRVGAVGAVAAAAAGLADWQHTNGRDRRVGAAHAAVNSTALALNLVSSRLRSRGQLPGGRLASATAWACMFMGGYLGGHMVYRRGIGVDHADRSPEPRDWAKVANLAELEEKKPKRVELWDENVRQAIGVVLVRRGEQVHALGARCSHLGGPLDQGWVLAGGLVCPWHGSRYDLETGRPVSGPSACPQPRYQVRLRDGAVEIRREQEPGDDVVASTDLPAPAAAPPQAQRGRKADDVLIAHHQLIRRLFETIRAMPPEDPERRDLMRALATELEIHEHIEDKVFYPAVRQVSEGVSIARSEHRQMADLLAMTLKRNTATLDFDEHVRALHEAVDHHAGSEERSMFKEAQRLGENRLRELGFALEALMEQQRTSRFRQGWMALKIRMLEGL